MTKPILSILLALVFLASCRKPQELKPQSSQEQIQYQNELISASQLWFKTIQANHKTKNTSMGRSVNLQDLPWMPQWDKAKFYPFSEEETLILVPVFRYANIGYHNEIGFTRRLKIVVNHAKQTMTGVIAEMLMEKSTLSKYQDDMFYYAHMQMLGGNEGKFAYYEVAVDSPVYLLSSIDSSNVRENCGNSDDPHNSSEYVLILQIPLLADICVKFYSDGCNIRIVTDTCVGGAGGGGLNPVNNPPMVVTIPTIPPLNFPGMMPALIPINSPISLPSIPSPMPWLPWLSYPIGGGDIGGIGSYPIDPGTNLVPEIPLSPEDQRVLDQLDRITERYGLLVALPNNGGYTEMYKIEGQDRLNLAYSLDKLIKSHPAYRNMYNLFISKNIKITWQINLRGVSSGDAKASINSNPMGRTNTIMFKYASTIKRTDIFAEELIHILQLDKLGDPFQVPSHQRVCIEFEAKAIVAMLSVNGSKIHPYGIFDLQNKYKSSDPDRWDAIQAFKNDFENFINTQFKKGTSLPKNRQEMDWTTFMSLLAKYKELAPPSYNFTGNYDANSWQWAIMFELFNY